MNRLGRAMADPTRSRILMTLLVGPSYPAVLSRELELSIWHGFYAPKGLAPDVQARLNTAIRQAAADPAFVADQQAQGVVMVRGSRLTPEGHKAYIEETIPLWQLIVSVSKAGAR